MNNPARKVKRDPSSKNNCLVRFLLNLKISFIFLSPLFVGLIHTSSIHLFKNRCKLQSPLKFFKVSCSLFQNKTLKEKNQTYVPIEDPNYTQTAHLQYGLYKATLPGKFLSFLHKNTEGLSRTD